MEYNVDDLTKEIRIAIDMNRVPDQLISEEDIDTLRIEEIILSKIEPAARIVESTAPRYLLDSGRAFGGEIGWRDSIGNGSGVIHLPDDFMRLVAFRMSDWERTVVEAIDEASPEYAKQSSRYSGIRGNPQKPVVAITLQPIGHVLEFYSCKMGDGVSLTRARYIPIPKIASNKGIDLCEKLKPAIVYYAAYLTAMEIGDMNIAKGLLETANELMK